jgi:hypothetical protein
MAAGANDAISQRIAVGWPRMTLPRFAASAPSTCEAGPVFVPPVGAAGA